MMAEFKGTKGKWEIKEKDKFCVNLETSIKCGDIRIAEAKHYNQGESDWTVNDPVYKEGYANALLISKAPEMLEMLIQVSKHHQGGHSEIGHKIKKLIKEATEI